MRAWRNTVVSFGMMSFPVSLSPLVGKSPTEGHRYDPATGERVRQTWTVDGESIVQETETRYDVPDSDPIPVDVALHGDTGVTLEAAVHIGDVDASLYDSSYAVNATKDAPKAVATLAAVLRDSGTILVGRARFTESLSAKSVVLRWSPLTKGVVLETLHPLERVRVDDARSESDSLEIPSPAEVLQGSAFVESLPTDLPELLVADERDEAIRGEIASYVASLSEDVPSVETDDGDEIEETAAAVSAFVQDGYDAAVARRSEDATV